MLNETPASALDPQEQHIHLGEITGMDRRPPKELLSLHRTWNGMGNLVHTHALLLTKKKRKPWKAWQNSLNFTNPGHSKARGVTFNPVPFDNPGKTALASLFILAQHSDHPSQGFLTKSHVELMKNNLSDVVCAIKLSRATVRNIKGNLFWAFFYNVLGIPVAAGILYPMFKITLTPMIGAAAMSASSVCVVSNALRLRRFKYKTPTQITINEEEEEKESKTMKKTLMINGMMCNHCRMHAEKALAAVDGVSEVTVSLEEKKAEVTLAREVADEILIKAVTDAGYEASII